MTTPCGTLTPESSSFAPARTTSNIAAAAMATRRREERTLVGARRGLAGFLVEGEDVGLAYGGRHQCAVRRARRSSPTDTPIQTIHQNLMYSSQKRQLYILYITHAWGHSGAFYTSKS